MQGAKLNRTKMSLAHCCAAVHLIEKSGLRTLTSDQTGPHKKQGSNKYLYSTSLPGPSLLMM